MSACIGSSRKLTHYLVLFSDKQELQKHLPGLGDAIICFPPNHPLVMRVTSLVTGSKSHIVCECPALP